jgi:CheY-like chemotaxis protein
MDTPEINQPDPKNEPNQQNQSNQSNPGFPGGNRNRRRRRRGRKGPGQQNARSQGGQGQPHGQGQFGGRRGSQQNRRGGPGQGQAGRRRRGGGRSPAAFVGPMDHSYRNANGSGNMGGMSVNGRFRSPGYQESELQAIPPSDDASTRVICFVDDLFFLAKIQEVARKIGVKVEFAKAEKETIDRITSDEDKPSLIIFDLNNANAKPLVTIPKLKSKLKKGTSIVGFLSHLQGDLKLKAQEAGCDMVVPKSAFSQNLPSLLRRHASADQSDSSEGM